MWKPPDTQYSSLQMYVSYEIPNCNYRVVDKGKMGLVFIH